MVDSIVNVLQIAANASLRKRRYRKKKLTRQRWFDDSCVTFKRECHRIGRLLSSNPSDLFIRTAFFSAKKRYKMVLKKTKRDFKASILGQLERLHSSDPTTYWKLVSDLKRENVNQVQEVVEPETWYNHFNSLLSVTLPSHTDFDRDIVNRIKVLENEPCFTELDYPIKQQEVDKVISNLKPRKAAGLDGVLNEMLKAGSDILRAPITVLFNRIFSSSVYPSEWSKGMISTIHKSGDNFSPENYRGITICSNLAKLYSSILNDRLVKFIENNNLRTKEQIGFKQKARPADHMFVLKTLIDSYTSKKGGKLFACFVDFSKAFDRVWWDGMFFKLLKSGIGGIFYKAIRSMYSNLVSCVRTSHGLTPYFNMTQGVRQGEPLSPLLFTHYINDLPQYVSDHSTAPVQLGGKDLQCLMFADDIVLLSESQEGLQNCLQNLNNYCNNWKLVVNINKTRVVIFNKAGHFLNEHFVLGQKQVVCVKSYKYLGIEFSNTGSFTKAKEELYIKAHKANFKLKNLIGSDSIPTQTTLHLFNMLIKPIALYGSEIWGASLCNQKIETVLKRLDMLPAEKVQLNCARFILGVHKRTPIAAIRGELGLFPISLCALRNVLHYRKRLLLAPIDSLLKYAVDENVVMADNCKTSWWSCVNELCKATGAKPESSSQVTSELRSSFVNNWKGTINRASDNKLRSYAKIKQHFVMENYLTHIPNQNYRKALARLRTSSHTLKIETGRYTRPKTPPEDRICPHCNSHAVEDEQHFLIKCSLYAEERKLLFNEISIQCANFTNMDDNIKFIYLLNMEHTPILATSKFIHNSFERRKQTLQN